MVSGTLQAAAGAALGATVGWTGIGAVAAAALVLNGAATVSQGIGQIVNSVTQTNTMYEDNILRAGVQSLGGAIGGDTGAEIAGMAYDVGIMVAAIYAPTVKAAPTPVSNRPSHTTGISSPKKVSNPGGSYTQLDSKGNIYSYAQYDDFGRQTLRIDFQGKSHAGVLPHIHIYIYRELGGRKEFIFDLAWNQIN